LLLKAHVDAVNHDFRIWGFLCYNLRYSWHLFVFDQLVFGRFVLYVDIFKKVFAALICRFCNSNSVVQFILGLQGSVEVRNGNVFNRRRACGLWLGRSKHVFLAVYELASEAIWAIPILSVLFALLSLVLGWNIALYHDLLFAMCEWTLQNAISLNSNL
jgi:hypothetical protein